MKSDADAKFDKTVEINGNEISPMVTWGTSPQDVVSITGIVPDPEKEKNEEIKEAMNRSLNYMGLKPNLKLTDINTGECKIVHGNIYKFSNNGIFGGTNLCHWKKNLYIGFAHTRYPYYSVPIIYDALSYNYITTKTPIIIKLRSTPAYIIKTAFERI